MPKPEIRYIDTASALDAACAACQKNHLLYIDTEFERTRTYFAKPALIQVYDGQIIYLLDPVAITQPAALNTLLQLDRTLPVMHAASEDLGLLAQLTGTPMQTLYDTQIAASFCGFENGLGYHSLVQKILDIEVSKEQTRSNWLQRPLSAAQLEYAALDVYHLPRLYAHLNERLDALNRKLWLEEEMALFISRVGVSEAQRDYLKLVKNIPDSAVIRSRLLHLCEWRDQLARQRNAPRRQLLDDSLLLSVVIEPPRNTATMDDLRHRHRASRRGRKTDLDAALAYLSTAPHKDLPMAAQHLEKTTVKFYGQMTDDCGIMCRTPWIASRTARIQTHAG